MASLGHIAVGMAAARLSGGSERPSWRSIAAWSALSMLPDADVAGMAAGIAYEDPWGHRGASHSLAFAFAIGGLVGVLAPRFNLPRLRTWIVATLVLITHALLDTLTDGGLGAALFWPFDLTRYFAPWRPIPVSPIGLAFFSAYGAFVATTELIVFAPLLVFALRSRPTRPKSRIRRIAPWPLWLSLVWLIGSTDPLRQRVLASVLGDDTEYASGYSERGFGSLLRGMQEDDVVRAVGLPLEQWWLYDTRSTTDCRLLRLVDDLVSAWDNFDRCTPADVQVHMRSIDVLRVLGRPTNALWEYSRSRQGGSFQARTVFFLQGKVEDVLRRWSPAEPVWLSQ